MDLKIISIIVIVVIISIFSVVILAANNQSPGKLNSASSSLSGVPGVVAILPADYTAKIGDFLTLDGSQSHGTAVGQCLSYSWDTGTIRVLVPQPYIPCPDGRNIGQSRIGLTIPPVNVDTVFTIKLTVSDGRSSATASTDISVPAGTLKSSAPPAGTLSNSTLSKLKQITVQSDKTTYYLPKYDINTHQIITPGDIIHITGTATNINSPVYVELWPYPFHQFVPVTLASDGSFSLTIDLNSDPDPFIALGTGCDNRPDLTVPVMVTSSTNIFDPNTIGTSTVFFVSHQPGDPSNACPAPPPPPPTPDVATGSCTRGITFAFGWDYTKSLYSERQPMVWIYGGSSYTSTLTCIDNPRYSSTTLHILKAGNPSTSCSDPNAKLDIAPGQYLTPQGMHTVFGTNQVQSSGTAPPPSPGFYPSLFVFPGPEMDNCDDAGKLIPIDIGYTIDYRN